MDFTTYTTENAPEASGPLLKAAEEKFGFIPNLLATFAESPALLEGYLKLEEALEKTDFTPVEQQVAVLAVSIENSCHYCSAVHSTVLKKKLNVDEHIVTAVREGETVPDEKLNALVNYVRKVVQDRGFQDESDVETFLNAGYSKRQALEVHLIVGLKTISNYTNHLAQTPLDEAFEPESVSFVTA